MSQNDGLPGTKGVQDALRVLDALAESRASRGVRELSASLGMSKSGCQRLLAALEAAGYVWQRDVDGGYELGWRVLQLATAYTRMNSVVELARPVMERLAYDTGETVCLYLPTRSGRVAVAQVESPLELRWAAQIGRSYPYRYGAAGKVLLAYAAAHIIATEIAQCATERGQEYADRLANEIRTLPPTRSARSHGENLPGVSGVAVVILDSSARAVASLSVYGPGSRTDERLDNYEHLLLAAGSEVTGRLGGEVSRTVDQGLGVQPDHPIGAPLS